MAGRLIDNDKERIYPMFWRTNDGGITWKIQDPGIPGDSDLRNTNYFAAIHQIDSLNVTAVGVSYGFIGLDTNSAIVLRSYDAGNTWQRQDLHVSGVVRDINFSDSLSGILNVQEDYLNGNTRYYGQGRERLFTTSDGGRHWDSVSVIFGNGSSVKFSVFCFGVGKFKFFKPPHGPVFSTTDNWKTIDTSNMPVPSASGVENRYLFNYCNFNGKDTIIAYGEDPLYDTTNSTIARYRAAIVRSTNGGNSWSEPQVFPGSLWRLFNMSAIDRDTILASGVSESKILMSSDRGFTWREDSLVIKDTNYFAFLSKGLVFTGNGNPLAICVYRSGGVSSPSIIIRGNIPKSRVEWSGLVRYDYRVFPNPSSDILYIISVDKPLPFWIVDMLGRTVLSGTTLDHSTLSVNISSLSPGAYQVMTFGVHGKMSIGKIMVAGR